MNAFIILGIMGSAVLLWVLAPILRDKKNKTAMFQAVFWGLCALALFLWASTPLLNYAPA